ncbi:MAG TPA: c-type cytochrome [Methylocella sp.]|nr:c-type cytochrome [Methylocella sp.]
MSGKTQIRWLMQTGAIAFCLGYHVSWAFAADAEKGKTIARRWCAACHVVSPDQKEGNTDAPSFASIARRKPKSRLMAFLTDPHPKMPDMSLTREEIADIAEYISSLKP